MRADPRSGKRRENKAGKGVLGLDAHAPDAAQAQDAAGRLAAARERSRRTAIPLVQVQLGMLSAATSTPSRASPVRGKARACVLEAASPRQVNRCSSSAVASIKRGIPLCIGRRRPGACTRPTLEDCPSLIARRVGVRIGRTGDGLQRSPRLTPALLFGHDIHGKGIARLAAKRRPARARECDELRAAPPRIANRSDRR